MPPQMLVGYLVLHRKTLGSWIWKQPPAAWKIFSGLLMLADYRDGIVRIGQRKLAEELCVSRMTLSKWLTEMESQEMVRRRGNRDVLVVNYADYQAKAVQSLDQGGTASVPERSNECTAPVQLVDQSGPVSVPRIKKKNLKNKKNPPTPLPDNISDKTLAAALSDWLDYKGPKAYKPKGLQCLLSRVQKLAAQHGSQAIADAMERAIANGWKGWDHDIGSGKVDPLKSLSQQRSEKAISEFMARHSTEEESNGQPRNDIQVRSDYPALPF